MFPVCLDFAGGLGYNYGRRIWMKETPMAKPRYRAVIWDWNGTLIDDFQASLMTSNEILRRRGMPPITREQYYSFMGYPISKFWENLFDLEVTPMTEIGRDYYDIYPSFDSTLCDGAEDLLRLLCPVVHYVLHVSGQKVHPAVKATVPIRQSACHAPARGYRHPQSDRTDRTESSGSSHGFGRRGFSHPLRPP